MFSGDDVIQQQRKIPCVPSQIPRELQQREEIDFFPVPSQPKKPLADSLSPYGLFVNKQTEVWKLVTDQLGFCSCS